MARRIVVSGAASGIGAALVGMLRQQGDEVIGVDLHDAEVCADLATEEGRSSAVESVLAASGGVLDGAVACAGLSGNKSQVVRVNYFGTLAFLDGVRPALAAAEQPRAAVVGSTVGAASTDTELVRACLEGDEPAALARAEQLIEDGSGGLIYPSSKAALAQWLRRSAITAEWAGNHIPLNAVAPGVVRTPMSAPLFEDAQRRTAMDRAVPMPLNGHAEPETIAESLRWLASPANTHITGQVLYVDGGAEATLRGPEAY